MAAKKIGGANLKAETDDVLRLLSKNSYIQGPESPLAAQLLRFLNCGRWKWSPVRGVGGIGR